MPIGGGILILQRAHGCFQAVPQPLGTVVSYGALLQSKTSKNQNRNSAVALPGFAFADCV